jgi:PAS domain S-box-containing protein
MRSANSKKLTDSALIDVTKFMRLDTSEASFRSIYEHASTGIAISDPQTRLAHCNPAFARILGYDEEELVGKSFASLIYPEDRESNMAKMAQLIAGEIDALDIVNRYVRKSGEPVWVHKYLSMIFDTADVPTGVLALVTDLTQNKQDALALNESEERFRALAATIPALIFVADGSGANTYSNPQFSAYSGLDFGTLLGDGWLRAIHPEDRERAAQTWEASWRTHQPYQAEYRFRGANGDYRWFLVRGNPVQDERGNTIEWIGTCTDIEDAVEMRDALAKSRSELERVNSELEAKVAARTIELTRANRSLRAEVKRREATQAALVQSQKLEALGQLTSGIAHDFNNILAVITGGLALIESRIDDQSLKDLAQHCKDASFRGAKLVKQMLAFARQEVLAPVAIDLSILSAEITALITQAIPGIDVSFDFPPELPKVKADPVLLESALLNLSVNARDAMPTGGKLSISAAVSPVGARSRPVELSKKEAIAITVRDTGKGIPPEIVQRVTEPFFTTKGIGEGTGLGLAMVHGFVTQSGGAMQIESRPNGGTSVTLYLPCAGDDTAQAALPVDGIANVVRGTADVLLVDDDRNVRAVTAAQLRDLGYTVTQASSRDEALSVLNGVARFDCVVSDVVMPDGDGISLAAAARAQKPNMPFLFMTGRSDSDRVAGELVLQKPFTVAELSQAVAGLLERASASNPALRLL